MRELFQKYRIYLYGILLFIVIGVIFVNSFPKYYYATDEPFLIVSSYSAGPDDYRNMYDRNVAIYNDGRLLLYTTEDDAPALEIQLADEQVEDVKKVVKQKRFLQLPEDISTDSEDGGYQYITVNLTDKTKRVGGLNTDNERFDAIYYAAWGLIENEDYKDWKVEVEEHIWERNSLLKSEKADFLMDEPFIVFSKEADWATEYSTDWTKDINSVYHQNISIDMAGNLTLYAEAEESDMKVGKNDPVIKEQITDSELEEIQALIREHFWKLNEYIENPDGHNREESITVHLTEEEKTVRGIEPINTRFIAIRDYMINLVEEEGYESWTKEITDDLWKRNVLHLGKKMDYIKDEPFLILRMEQEWKGNTYYLNISFDMDGSVVLYPEELLRVEIADDAPILEMLATDKEINKIKELLEEHFWKIDEFNYNGLSDMGLDSITVNLNHDTRTITGNDPDDFRFMAIRNEMIDFIDVEVFEIWKKEVEDHLIIPRSEFYDVFKKDDSK